MLVLPRRLPNQATFRIVFDLLALKSMSTVCASMRAVFERVCFTLPLCRAPLQLVPPEARSHVDDMYDARKSPAANPIQHFGHCDIASTIATPLPIPSKRKTNSKQTPIFTLKSHHYIYNPLDRGTLFKPTKKHHKNLHRTNRTPYPENRLYLLLKTKRIGFFKSSQSDLFNGQGPWI